MLSIVIITRNTKELLSDLLLSIGKDEPLAPVLKETIVVDNGSTDGTSSMLSERFASVIQVNNGRNLGFAAAVNRGYARSSGEYVLFLNSDTRLIPGELLAMLHWAEQDKSVGIVGPQLVYEDQALQRSFAIPPSLLQEIVPRFILKALSSRYAGGKGGRAQEPMQVGSLIGAAILVRRTLLDRLGGFDERFFFFLEETDFCLRATRSGYKVVFFPGSRIIHLQGKTVGKSWIAGRIEYAISLYKFIRKHHSAPYHAAFVAIRFIKTLIFLAPSTILCFWLFKGSMRRKYLYYLRLFQWHLRGCPDTGGLRG